MYWSVSILEDVILAGGEAVGHAISLKEKIKNSLRFARSLRDLIIGSRDTIDEAIEVISSHNKEADSTPEQTSGDEENLFPIKSVTDGRFIRQKINILDKNVEQKNQFLKKSLDQSIKQWLQERKQEEIIEEVKSETTTDTQINLHEKEFLSQITRDEELTMSLNTVTKVPSLRPPASVSEIKHKRKNTFIQRNKEMLHKYDRKKLQNRTPKKENKNGNKLENGSIVLVRPELLKTKTGLYLTVKNEERYPLSNKSQKELQTVSEEIEKKNKSKNKIQEDEKTAKKKWLIKSSKNKDNCEDESEEKKNQTQEILDSRLKNEDKTNTKDDRSSIEMTFLMKPFSEFNNKNDENKEILSKNDDENTKIALMSLLTEFFSNEEINTGYQKETATSTDYFSIAEKTVENKKRKSQIPRRLDCNKFKKEMSVASLKKSSSYKLLELKEDSEKIPNNLKIIYNNNGKRTKSLKSPQHKGIISDASFNKNMVTALFLPKSHTCNTTAVCSTDDTLSMKSSISKQIVWEVLSSIDKKQQKRKIRKAKRKIYKTCKRNKINIKSDIESSKLPMAESVFLDLLTTKIQEEIKKCQEIKEANANLKKEKSTITVITHNPLNEKSKSKIIKKLSKIRDANRPELVNPTSPYMLVLQSVLERQRSVPSAERGPSSVYRIKKLPSVPTRTLYENKGSLVSSGSSKLLFNKSSEASIVKQNKSEVSPKTLPRYLLNKTQLVEEQRPIPAPRFLKNAQPKLENDNKSEMTQYDITSNDTGSLENANTSSTNEQRTSVERILKIYNQESFVVDLESKLNNHLNDRYKKVMTSMAEVLQESVNVSKKNEKDLKKIRENAESGRNKKVFDQIKYPELEMNKDIDKNPKQHKEANKEKCDTSYSTNIYGLIDFFLPEELALERRNKNKYYPQNLVKGLTTMIKEENKRNSFSSNNLQANIPNNQIKEYKYLDTLEKWLFNEAIPRFMSESDRNHEENCVSSRERYQNMIKSWLTCFTLKKISMAMVEQLQGTYRTSFPIDTRVKLLKAWLELEGLRVIMQKYSESSVRQPTSEEYREYLRNWLESRSIKKMISEIELVSSTKLYDNCEEINKKTEVVSYVNEDNKKYEVNSSLVQYMRCLSEQTKSDTSPTK